MDSDQASARICLLGKPALFIGGRLQPFGGPRKAIALLAYVLLHRERALSRAAVAEQFWPDEDDESARASLRRHLYRALAALPEAPAKHPWVIADKVTLRWNPDASLEIDTNAYERLSAAGQRESAVGLYRGDYLEDFYDEWMLPERERLRELQSANLVALVEERRRALDYPGAIAFAQSLLRLDPLREDAIRRLMSLRFAAGDRSGALADFETFSRRLRDELAADPMPETLALREAIRSNDLSTLERGQAGPTRISRPGFPFAGRSAALQALREAWESAAHGTATTAIVSGEAGAGKSRLIAELMVLAEAQGGRVMFGTTATIESEPYQPVAEALRGALPLLRFDRLEAVKLAALSALAPDVRELAPGLPQLPQLEPERDRQRLFDAVESAIEHLAEKRPLLIVLEDLHWAGAATIELLEFLVRRLRGTSVLLTVSFREEDVDASHALRGFLRRLDVAHSSHVALGPLKEEDARALIAEIASEDRDAMARELYAASEGNALFLTELLRERLSGAAADSVPGGIADTVVARMNRLSPPARSMVETAAVVGVGFDAEVVRQACGWSFAEVFDALDELMDRALVRVSPQRRGDFAFSHQLVQAAVYGTVEETARRALHRRVARTLEGLFPERPSLHAIVARHFEAAGFDGEAVVRYLAAVRYALDVFAQAEALDLATRALELSTEPRDRFELHRLREEAASRAGDSGTRRRDCASMTEIARALGDDSLLGTALARAIWLSLHHAERDAAAAYIGELHSLGERGESRWAVEAAVAQARLEIDRSDHREAETILCSAQPLVAELIDDAAAFEYWYQRGFNASWTNPPLARTCLDEARSRVGADRVLATRALRMETHLADLAGDAPALVRIARELLDIYLEIGDIEGQATAHKNLAMAAFYGFDVAANREHTSKALALFERIGNPHSAAAVIWHRGASAQYLGDFATAEADFLQVRSIWESLGIPGNVCSATSCLASLASFRGDHRRARELALEALTFAREYKLEREEIGALDNLGTAERELGMLEPACENLEAALCWHRDQNPRQVLDSLIEIIPVYLGLERIDEALALADELLAGIAGHPTRVSFPAQALSIAASAYAASGQQQRANALHSQARDLLRELAERIDDVPSRNGYVSLCVHRTIFPSPP